jgi:UPF0755 protein
MIKNNKYGIITFMKYKIFAKYKCFVLLLEVFGVLALMPFFYQLIPINDNAQKVLYINSSNPDDIAKTLNDNGYEVTIIDKFIMQTIKIPTKGWYRLDTKQNRVSFFKTIYKNKASTMKVKIYAGESSDELIVRLARDMKLDAKKLKYEYLKRTKFIEADIIAGNYMIARKATEKTVMDFLFKVSNEKLQEFIANNFTKTPSKKFINVLLTMASIIQKETNNVNEMPIISSVIHNRINKGMKLQMDATLNYKNKSHTIVTSQMIKEDNSKYNTYKYKGLPPTPIGTITIDALHSAMHPIRSDYLFFMLQRDGTHAFASTYKKHLKNINRFKYKRK